MRVATLLVLSYFLFAAAVSAKEDALAPVSTRCRENAVKAAEGAAMTLGACGEEGAADLLWHLDRIDQLDGRL
ncbi:MAG TPA: hypothetical protein VFL80_13630, partial [Thermoanaerobaculia bacterium]|nr:hypothetical protein [Thermoanaerobaculia bacterium]